MLRSSLVDLRICGALVCCLAGCGGDDTASGGATTSTSATTTTSSTGSGGETGAGGSTGTGGATGTSTGGSGGAVDPCENRLICDDFEDDQLDTEPLAPWQSSTNAGSIVVDGTHAHSGAKAVHVHTEEGQYKRALFSVEGAPTFPIAGNVVYGRMMIYMDQTANDGVHWTMIQGSGPLDGQPGVDSHYRYGGMWGGAMMANYETSGASTDCWNNTDVVMPTGAWTCMEWRFDGPQNEMRFWLDGVEVPELHVKDQGMGCIGHDLNDQWLAPTFDRMYVGWESYQQDGARDAWIDDVVIDDQPIGCP